jgi:hypothetical protein
MKYTFFAIALIFALSCSAQQTPQKRFNQCQPWYDMIAQAKKENKLSAEHAALIIAQVKNAGCGFIKVRDSQAHEALYKTAGATAECTIETAVIPGAGPFYKKFCYYSINFRSLNAESNENKN